MVWLDARRELFALIAAMVGGVGAALTISSIWKISIDAACECNTEVSASWSLRILRPRLSQPANRAPSARHRTTSATKDPFAGRIALDQIDTREPAVRVQC
jgi:hypothetical protein